MQQQCQQLCSSPTPNDLSFIWCMLQSILHCTECGMHWTHTVWNKMIAWPKWSVINFCMHSFGANAPDWNWWSSKGSIFNTEWINSVPFAAREIRFVRHRIHSSKVLTHIQKENLYRYWLWISVDLVPAASYFPDVKIAATMCAMFIIRRFGEGIYGNFPPVSVCGSIATVQMCTVQPCIVHIEKFIEWKCIKCEQLKAETHTHTHDVLRWIKWNGHCHCHLSYH